MSDRRSRPRYEIVGALRGTLVAYDELPLENVSAGGFSIETASPLAIDSIHSVRLDAHGTVIDVDVRVRHCTARADADRYTIGVELMRPLPSVSVQQDEPVRSDSTQPS